MGLLANRDLSMAALRDCFLIFDKLAVPPSTGSIFRLSERVGLLTSVDNRTY